MVCLSCSKWQFQHCCCSRLVQALEVFDPFAQIVCRHPVSVFMVNTMVGTHICTHTHAHQHVDTHIHITRPPSVQLAPSYPGADQGTTQSDRRRESPVDECHDGQTVTEFYTWSSCVLTAYPLQRRESRGRAGERAIETAREQESKRAREGVGKKGMGGGTLLSRPPCVRSLQKDRQSSCLKPPTP